MTRYAKSATGGKRETEEGTAWQALKQTISPEREKNKKRKKVKESVAETTVAFPVKAADLAGDQVIKKLKKKNRNKQKVVEEAMKLEQNNQGQSNFRPKQGKGSQKFSNIHPAVKRMQRAEVHRNRRAAKNPCFVCRSTRHKASDCPKGNEKGVGLCFKCASTEHTSATCPRTDIKGYPHAVCFICNETGHLSRACPDNPRGLYPNGGCCKECGGIEHFAKDCPNKVRQRQRQDIKLKSLSSSKSNVEDDDMMDLEEFVKVKKQTPPVQQQKKPKVVNF